MKLSNKSIVEKCQLLQVRLRLREAVRERLANELGFPVDDEDNVGLYKSVNDTVCLYFGSNPEDCLYWIGFWSDGGIKDVLKNKLQETLDMVTEEYFELATDWDEPEHWLVKRFLISEYNGSLPNIADYLIEKYRLLEENVRKALEA